MTVEISDHAIAISTVRDWLKNRTPVFQPMRSKNKTSRTSYAWFFPRFESYRQLLRINLIGSSRCFLLLWLVRIITLVLVFRQSFETRSDPKTIVLSYQLLVLSLSPMWALSQLIQLFVEIDSNTYFALVTSSSEMSPLEALANWSTTDFMTYRNIEWTFSVKHYWVYT